MGTVAWRRRVDWLAVTLLILVVGQSVAAMALLVQVFLVMIGSPVQIELPLADAGGVDEAGRAIVPGRPEDDVTISPEFWIEAWIKEPTVVESLLSVARVVPTILVAAAMMTILMRVVSGARSADPFTARNVRRLRILGLVVLVGGPLAEVAEAIAGWVLIAPMVDSGALGGFVVTGWWLVGVAFLAIAEVVNRGATMRAELDSVI